VGEVLEFEHSSRPPLVFHSGKYAVAVAPPETAEQSSAESSELDSSFSQDFLIYLLGRAHFQLFLGLRSELEHHGLSEDEWFVMSILGVSGHRTVEQLDRQLFYTGKRVSYRLVARLASAGFVTLQGGHDPNASVNLTPYGMEVVVKLVAAAKSVEAQSQQGLGDQEIRQLKILLRRIIQNTDHAVPAVLPTVDPGG
jgi:3-hydroxy-9,10-secoandrosta-1,3,5(10)-triene-9,17-dione monooxygenase reductase component